jgi:hypothetical protein
MLFVVLFLSGMLVLPVMFDSHKHGAENIFRRSGNDILQYQAVGHLLRFFHISAQRLNAAVIGVLGVAGFVLIFAAVVRVLRFF